MTDQQHDGNSPARKPGPAEPAPPADTSPGRRAGDPAPDQATAPAPTDKAPSDGTAAAVTGADGAGERQDQVLKDGSDHAARLSAAGNEAPAGDEHELAQQTAEAAARITEAVHRHDTGLPPRDEGDQMIYEILDRLETAPQSFGLTGRESDVTGQPDATPGRAIYQVWNADHPRPQVPVSTWLPDAAIEAGLEMSSHGGKAHAIEIGADGTARLFARFHDGQLVQPEGFGNSAVQAGPPDLSADDLLVRAPGPAPGSRVRTAAEAGLLRVPLPPGHPDRRQFPAGIAPLPEIATAGGGLRPGRLLYPDGTMLDCRLAGQDPTCAVAAGVVPGPDSQSGWLQVVRHADGRLQALHPALISPQGIDPYAWAEYRPRARFREFDSAEAIGRSTAYLPAHLVDAVDFLTVRNSADLGDAELRMVMAADTMSGGRIRLSSSDENGTITEVFYNKHDTVEVLIPDDHPAQHGRDAVSLFASAEDSPHPAAHRVPSPAAAADETAAETAAPAAVEADAANGDRHLAALQHRIERVQERLGMKQTDTGLPPAAATPPGRDWRPSITMAEALQAARDGAAASIPALQDQEAWRRLSGVIDDSARVARDAQHGRLRFTVPAGARQTWNVVWARACEITGDIASGLMERLRGGSRAWAAARRLHHAAAEGVAHACGWLPRGDRLPLGAYEPPPGKRAPTWIVADAAARLHAAGTGPLSRIDFPGPLSGALLRPTTGPVSRHRHVRAAARTSASAAPTPTTPHR